MLPREGEMVYSSHRVKFKACHAQDTILCMNQGPYRALKILKNLEFDWTKFKALKSLNFTK